PRAYQSQQSRWSRTAWTRPPGILRPVPIPPTGRPRTGPQPSPLAKSSGSTDHSFSSGALRRTCMAKVSLLSLATAVPPYSVAQSVAKTKAREVFGGRKELFDRLASVFDNAGIERRHIVAPTSWYESSHGWNERNRVYL